MNTITKFYLPLLTATMVVSMIIASCSRQAKDDNPQPLIHQPVQLGYDTTEIWPADFLPPDATVDSLSINGVAIPVAGEKVLFSTPEGFPVMGVMEIFSNDLRVDVPLRKSSSVALPYRFDPKGISYGEVSLKGEFNGWVEERTPLTLNEGFWQTELVLPGGEYQYLVVADGMEMTDPDAGAPVDNNMGGRNSLLMVGEVNPDALPVLLTQSHTKRSVTLSAENQPDKILVFWNNTVIPSDQISHEDQTIVISVPRIAGNHVRSFLRVYAWNREGRGNDVLIPLHYGKVITNPDLLTRHDFHKTIMYNVFVDRFFNGDPHNDKRLPDSLVLPAANYHGGDLAGVLQKLLAGYFEKLGVNTLWLSPVVKNTDGPFGWWPDPPTKFSAYHGYWPVSFTEIDSHFGRKEDMMILVSEAHNSQMNILLDFVANHVHRDHPFFVRNPDIATPLELPDGSLNLERWDEHRLTTWFDVFLPSLDLEREDIADIVSDSALWWVTQYNVDGFRHDAAKHVPLSFWRMLTRKIRHEVTWPQHRPVLQLGETYGSAQLISSYMGSGLLDAQFDFNLFDAALGSFAGGKDFSQIRRRMRESLNTYGWHNLMGNITGNQDRARFVSYAGGELSFSEDAKKAGWTRKIGVGDPVAYDKLGLMMAFIMTIPGIPVIYYGDEIGLAGGNDPDCRRMMRFGDDLNHHERKLHAKTQRLAHIRNNNMALLYGDFTIMDVRQNTMVLARTYFGNTVVVLFNNSNIAAEIPVALKGKQPPYNYRSDFGAEVKENSAGVTVTLNPWSFEVLTLN